MSNRLFLTRLIHGRHRPILDLLPSLLYRGRQLVHVLEEKRKRPDLLVAERVAERRHARQTNTVLDLPERNTFWVVLNPIDSQLRWLLIEAFRYRCCRRSALRGTMTNRAVLREKVNSVEEILLVYL